MIFEIEFIHIKTVVSSGISQASKTQVRVYDFYLFANTRIYKNICCLIKNLMKAKSKNCLVSFQDSPNCATPFEKVFRKLASSNEGDWN